MFFSGIADEAATQLDQQIAAHKELGWKHIELRNVDGINLTDMDDAAFKDVANTLDANGLQVSCFASQLANWARRIDGDYNLDLNEMERAITRMERLGAPFIRCMSYPNAEVPWKDSEWLREAVRRLRGLSKMAEQAGVTLVHENCSGWGGQSGEHTLRLLAEVDSDHFKLVWDTGNPHMEGQDAWEYYSQVADHIAYVHIKDYKIGENGEAQAVFPGEGTGAVRRTIEDLLALGYDGGFSIEPHITSVIHLQQEAADPELAYRTYIEYGRKLEELFHAI